MAAFGSLPRLVAASRKAFPHVELILQEASSAEPTSQNCILPKLTLQFFAPPIEQAPLQSFCLSD